MVNSDEKFFDVMYRLGKRTSLEDLDLNDLSTIEFILGRLPIEISTSINVNGNEYDYLSDYIQDRTDQFFETTREDYERIVGTCFINDDKSIVLKVLGLPDIDEKGENESNFLFEQFEKWKDGSWHNKDYIWLQNTVHTNSESKFAKEYAEKYEKYCYTPQTEINLNAEGMYMLGKDGNLYSDYTCGGDYIIFRPMKTTTFELIREEAIDNDGEYRSEED